MKFSNLAVLGAALVLAAPFAKADMITGSIAIGSGNVTLNGPSSAPTSVSFNQGPYLVGATSGTFSSAGLSGESVTFENNLSFSSPNGLLFTIPVNLASFTIDSVSANGFVLPGLYAIQGTGLFTEAGYDPTEGNFTLSLSGSGQVVALEFTGNAVPEPSSLMLLGSGMVSAAGMLLRRRRTA